jgi:thioredoxin-related protein
MKRSVCFLFYSFFMAVAAMAQEIKFLEESSLSELIMVAKRENKLIFLDAYADWCRPCKFMQLEVFTDPDVGKYYNRTFINAKMDMEKGEGLKVAQKFNVKAYPTFLFINGNGELIHKSVGGMMPEDFLELGSNALLPEKQFYTIEKKAKDGKIPPVQFDSWIRYAKEMEEEDLQDVINSYLSKDTYPFWSKEVVDLVLDHAESLSAERLKELNQKKGLLVELTGRAKADIDSILLKKVLDYALKGSFVNNDSFDFAKYEKSISAYFPDKSANETKKLRIKWQLINGTVDFSQVIASEDEETLMLYARCYYNIGVDKENKEYLNRAKQLYLKLSKQKPDNESYIVNILKINNELNSLEESNYFGKVERLKQNASLKEKYYAKSGLTSTEAKDDLSTDYGNLSWYQLFVKDFNGVVESAKKGLQVWPANEWIYTNLALGYLLSGKYTEATAIYTKYKSKQFPAEEAKLFKDVFLKDLDDLEAEGIFTPDQATIIRDVTKIRALLKK